MCALLFAQPVPLLCAHSLLRKTAHTSINQLKSNDGAGRARRHARAVPGRQGARGLRGGGRGRPGMARALAWERKMGGFAFDSTKQRVWQTPLPKTKTPLHNNNNPLPRPTRSWCCTCPTARRTRGRTRWASRSRTSSSTSSARLVRLPLLLLCAACCRLRAALLVLVLVSLTLHPPKQHQTKQRTITTHTITSTGIPADRQQLSLGATGRPMLDVLCLSDYPQVAPGAANEVRVALAEGG